MKLKEKKNINNNAPKRTKFGELKRTIFAIITKITAFFQGLLKSQIFISLFFLATLLNVFVFLLKSHH
jgi:hypothetical protein